MTAVAEFRRQERDLVAVVRAEVVRYWETLDLADPTAVVLALEEFIPALIAEYGDVGAAMAADFYDELREAEPAVRRAYRARLGDAVPLDQARASTRWAVGPLFGRGKNPGPEQALANVVAITGRLARTPARLTIVQNAAADPEATGYRRVAGRVGCTFCRFLAARGAVYRADTATFAAHDRCGCTAVPAWGGTPASVAQYRASARHRTPADRARIREALAEFEG